MNKRDLIFKNVKYGKMKLIDLQYCYDEMIKNEEYEKAYIINSLMKYGWYSNDSNFHFLDDNDGNFSNDENNSIKEIKNKLDILLDKGMKKMLLLQDTIIYPNIDDKKFHNYFIIYVL